MTQKIPAHMLESATSALGDGTTDDTAAIEADLAAAAGDGRELTFSGLTYRVSGLETVDGAVMKGVHAPAYNDFTLDVDQTILRALTGASSVIDASQADHQLFENLYIYGGLSSGDRYTAIGLKTGDGTNVGGSITGVNLTAFQCVVGYGQTAGQSDSVALINPTACGNDTGFARIQDGVILGGRAISNRYNGLHLVGGSDATHFSGRLAHNGDSATGADATEGHGASLAASRCIWLDGWYVDFNEYYGLRALQVTHSQIKANFNRNYRADPTNAEAGHARLKECENLVLDFTTHMDDSDGGDGINSPENSIVLDQSGNGNKSLWLRGTWSGHNSTGEALKVLTGEVDERIMVDGPDAPVLPRETGNIAASNGTATKRLYFPRTPRGVTARTAISGRIFVALRLNSSSATKAMCIIDWMLDTFNGSSHTFTAFMGNDHSSGALGLGSGTVSITFGTPTIDGEFVYVDMTLTNTHGSNVYQAFIQANSRYH